jgi:hypothetical protein
MKSLASCALFVALAMPAAANAQGIPGGAERGYDEGNCVAGPIGAVIGAAVGGVVGGLVGGVNGMLGIEQRKDTDRRDRGRTEPRCENQRRR